MRVESIVYPCDKNRRERNWINWCFAFPTYDRRLRKNRWIWERKFSTRNRYVFTNSFFLLISIAKFHSKTNQSINCLLIPEADSRNSLRNTLIFDIFDLFKFLYFLKKNTDFSRETILVSAFYLKKSSSLWIYFSCASLLLLSRGCISASITLSQLRFSSKENIVL